MEEGEIDRADDCDHIEDDGEFCIDCGQVAASDETETCNSCGNTLCLKCAAEATDEFHNTACLTCGVDA